MKPWLLCALVLAGCGDDDAAPADAARRVDAAPGGDAAVPDGAPLVIDAAPPDGAPTIIDAGGGAGLDEPCGLLDAGQVDCKPGLACCYPCGIPDCVFRCAVPCDGGPECAGGCYLFP